MSHIVINFYLRMIPAAKSTALHSVKFRFSDEWLQEKQSRVL